MSHRRAQQVLWVTGTVLLFGYLVITLRPAIEREGLERVPALAGALLLAAAAVAPLVRVMRWAWTVDYLAARAPYPSAMALALALPWSVVSFLWGRATFGLSAGTAVAVACAYALVQFAVVRRQVVNLRHARVWRLTAVSDPADADELVAECRTQLLDASLSDEQRAGAEVNLANGLVSLSTRAGHHDVLPEAQAIIERTMAGGRAGWVVAGSVSLGCAMMVKAQRSGDFRGLRASLDLLVRAAETAPGEFTDALKTALWIRSEGLVMLSFSAEADGDTATAEHDWAHAVADLERALTLTRRGSSARAMLTTRLARIGWQHEQDADLDAWIRRCRRAVRRLRLQRVSQREDGYLALADLLTHRAVEDPSHHLEDLAEAVRLCRIVADHGERKRAALRRLPGLLDVGGADAEVVAHAYRRAFDAHVGFSLGEAGELAEEWAAWAVEESLVDEAAQAHWCWIQAVVEESRRRLLRTAREHELLRIQGMAASAGFWLSIAGRRRDAALALDLGRAMQVTELMHRDREGLAERLDAAGHGAVAERWREASAEAARADREGYEPDLKRLETSTILLGDHRVAAPFSTSGQAALAEHERLLHDIGLLAGFEDVAAPPSYDDLREAAREGPPVYLAAADRGAYAVVVTTSSEEPEWVVLKGVTPAEVDKRVRSLMDAPDAHETAEDLARTLDWLWAEIVEPVTAGFAPTTLVTVVAVGALGLLPIHAAGMVRTRDGTWVDRGPRLVFRYAPNARVLLRALATARSFAEEDAAMLTVGVANAPGAPPLPCATMESEAVAALFGAGGPVRRTASGTVAEVTEQLHTAAIWHLACHGEHDPVDPLQSSLRLADGPLTLQALFARMPDRKRLAVLSACGVALAHETLLDEVVGFPSALLQAGVAGVVCSRTAISDHGAMLLSLRFFANYLQGWHPARALAEAQAWLAAASNRQINEAFPAVHAPPAYLLDAARSRWKDECSFTEPCHWAAFSYTGA